MDAGISHAEQQAKRIGMLSHKFYFAGMQLSMAFTAPLTALVSVASYQYLKFDKAMTESTAIMSDVTQSIRKEMEDTAHAISNTSSFSAAEVARGYYHLASAGLNAQQTLKTIGIAERFAMAGQMDMGQSTELLTDSVNALGLATNDTAQYQKNMLRISDVLSQANNMAAGTTLEYAKALANNTAAAFALVGKSAEEAVSVLMAFASRGVRGEEAGEKLAIVMRDLQRSFIDNRSVWNNYGLAVYDVTGKMLPFSNILGQLENKMMTLSDEGKKVLLMQLGFQERSVMATMELIGFTSKIQEYEKALKDAGGTTQMVADKQMKSLSNQLSAMQHKWQTMFDNMAKGYNPQLGKFIENVGKLADTFSKLTPEAQFVIIKMLAFLAALGPAFMIMSGIINVATAFRTAFAFMGESIRGAGMNVLWFTGQSLRISQMAWEFLGVGRAATSMTRSISAARAALRVERETRHWTQPVMNIQRIGQVGGSGSPITYATALIPINRTNIALDLMRNRARDVQYAFQRFALNSARSINQVFNSVANLTGSEGLGKIAVVLFAPMAMIMELLSPITSGIISMGESIYNTFSSGIKFVWEMAAGIQKLTLLEMVLAAVGWIANLPWLALIGIMAGVASAIALVATIFTGTGITIDNLWETIKGFGQNVLGFFSHFGENMGLLWTWFKNNWADLFIDLIRYVAFFLEKLVGNFMNAFILVTRLEVVFGGWLVDQFEKIFTVDFWKAVWNGLVKAWDTITGWIGRLMVKVWDLIAGRSGDPNDQSLPNKLLTDYERQGSLADRFGQVWGDQSKNFEGMGGFKWTVNNMPKLDLNTKQPDNKQPKKDEAGGMPNAKANEPQNIDNTKKNKLGGEVSEFRSMDAYKTIAGNIGEHTLDSRMQESVEVQKHMATGIDKMNETLAFSRSEKVTLPR